MEHCCWHCEAEVAVLSRRNNSKSEIFLMEFIIVLLFFSICMTICVSGFVKANTTSEESKSLNYGILLAESAAECIKASDYAVIDERLNREMYPMAERAGYHLDVSKSMEKQLLTAVISVWDHTGIICELTVKKYIAEEGAASD